MNKKFCMNVSRGVIFQTFCSGILESRNADEEKYEKWRSLVGMELARLVRNRPIIWNRPHADICYFTYLKELKELLDAGANQDEIRALSDRAKMQTREKFHILFLTEEVSCWPSIEALYKEAAHDPECHESLVYTPFEHKDLVNSKDYYTEYKDEFKLPVIRHDAYDLESDSPDVVIMIKPYSGVPVRYQPKTILSVIPRVVYIPYGMEITVDLVRFAFQHYLQCKAWRHCAYGPIVKEYSTKYGYCNGENVVVWGHPKADHYIDKKPISEKFSKFINGRKTILWSPHHLVDLSKQGTGTWLIWGRQILELALNNQDIAFIFRPHPMMMGALKNNGFMTDAEAEEIIQKIENSGNILWDTNDSYLEAFHAADAIITDGTTFSIEFLYTGKPILLTPRNMSGFYASEEMFESYYVVNSIDDVERFIDMIRNESDPLREKRLALREKMFYIPEGKTTSKNIMDRIKKDLIEDCKKEVLKNVE